MNKYDEIKGPCGTATQLEIPDEPWARQTADHWLLTAPMYHPLWSQYVLACVRLEDDVPGFPPPHRQFPGATHELLVVALNPEHGPYSREKLREPGDLKYLTPVNICHQFIATDAEMRAVVPLAARAVVHGALNPETGDAPERIRQEWLSSLVKALAHARGEEHAP